MATNGLDRKEERALGDSLRRLDALLEKRCLFGAGEAHRLALLADKIRERLDPASPDELVKTATERVDGYRGTEFVDKALEGL